MNVLKLITTLSIVFVSFLFVPSQVFAQCSTEIDLLEYMAPTNGESFDLRYCSPNGSGSEPVQVNRDTVQTVEGPKPGFFINKGSNYEAYFYDSGGVYIYEDISWDETCPSGAEAFYRVFTPPGGAAGGRMTRCLNSGDSFSSPQQIKAYDETGYTHGNPGNICNDSYPPTTISATVRFAAGDPYAPTVPGTGPNDTIAMTNASGAGAGETKYYTKGYGLTGFRAVDASGNVFFWSSFYKDGLSTSEPELNCSGTGSEEGGFNVNKYPPYDVIDELFFLTPIRSIIKDNIPERTVENLREELALSGYESYCAAEDVKIEPKYDTKGLIDKFVRQHPEGISLETDSVEGLDFRQAEYPIWRNVSDKQFLMTSLEEYFGFKDVYETNPARSEITTAPINSLLSQKQACLQGWRDLVAQQITCEKLEKPAECALLPRPIPPGNFTVQTLLDELGKFEPAYREGKAREGCEKLFGENPPEWEELKIGLTNVPTYFDRAYRYGFVVAAIHTKSPEKSGNEATKIFNFFTREADDEVPRDEVLAAAFKLPDIGTNKGGEEATSGHQYWDDPLDLTRMVLTTNEKNIEHADVLRPERRREILNNAIGAEIQSEGSRIYCCEGPFDEGKGDCTISCQNELPKALTDIINGNMEACEQDPEIVKIIKDMAGLGNPQDPYGKIFTLEYGGQTLLNLFGGSMYNWNAKYFDPQKAETRIIGDSDSKIKTLWTINENTWGPDVDETTVDFYLVYPVGFELAAVEEAMKGAFFTKDQIGTMNNDPTIVKNFEMTGQKQGLAGGKVSWDFVDTEATANGECGVDPITFQNNTCKETVSIRIKQDGTGIGVLGGKLSWWLRKIQVALSARTKFAWSYYLSCKTMEEFLLGKCNTSLLQPNPDNPGGPPVVGSNLYCVNWIGLSSSQVSTYKQSMRNYLMGFNYSTGSQKPQYIAQLTGQTHIDWTGREIQPDETNYWENFYGGGRALLWTKNSACGGKACFDYIMDKCGDRGVNPAICIGMSLTESGGLNHIRFPGTYDFGCLAGSPNDINSGLDCLLDKFFFSDTPRDGKLIRDMNFNEMWLQFAGENFESSSYRRLQEILKAAGEVGYSPNDCPA